MISDYTTEIQVRFVDLDAYAHVNNSVYLTYMEISRLPILGKTFLEHMKENIQYLLVKAELNYIVPITQGDKVPVRCWISEVTGARFKMSYQIHNGDGTTFATGQTQHAMFNSNKGKPMRLPEHWKKLVKNIEL